MNVIMFLKHNHIQVYFKLIYIIHIHTHIHTYINFYITYFEVIFGHL